VKKIRNPTTINSKNKIIIPLLLLTLALIFSFTTTTVSAEFMAAPPSDTVTIYVNDTGGSDDNNGTSWDYAKKSILNATETVETNGIINIANGQYTGTNNTGITLNKNMTIIGESQSGTIINGTGPIFIIGTEINVIIQNLMITNGTSSFGGGIWNKGNLTVDNCIFTNNKTGIAHCLWSASFRCGSL
jgi:hypothetical protein